MSDQPVSTRTLPPEIDEIIELPTIQLEEIDEELGGTRQEEMPTVNLSDNHPEQAVAALPEAAVAVAVATSLRDVDVQGGASTRNLNFKDTRAEFVSVTFWKDHPGIPLGISFKQGLPEVTIESLKVGSLAELSPLRAGDKLLSVNNKQVGKNQLNNRAQVGRILRESFGNVTLVVHNPEGASDLVESMIMKSDPKEKVGISMRSYQGGRIAISDIAKGGKFQNSLLNEGDSILSINGTAVAQLDIAAAKDLIAQAPTRITILARTLRETGVVVAEVSDRYLANSTSVPVISASGPAINHTSAANNSGPVIDDHHLRLQPTIAQRRQQESEVQRHEQLAKCFFFTLVVGAVVAATLLSEPV